jgi:hypothetical protein
MQVGNDVESLIEQVTYAIGAENPLFLLMTLKVLMEYLLTVL